MWHIRWPVQDGFMNRLISRAWPIFTRFSDAQIFSESTISAFLSDPVFAVSGFGIKSVPMEEFVSYKGSAKTGYQAKGRMRGSDRFLSSKKLIGVDNAVSCRGVGAYYE